MNKINNIIIHYIIARKKNIIFIASLCGYVCSRVIMLTICWKICSFIFCIFFLFARACNCVFVVFTFSSNYIPTLIYTMYVGTYNIVRVYSVLGTCSGKHNNDKCSTHGRNSYILTNYIVVRYL